MSDDKKTSIGQVAVDGMVFQDNDILKEMETFADQMARGGNLKVSGLCRTIIAEGVDGKRMPVMRMVMRLKIMANMFMSLAEYAAQGSDALFNTVLYGRKPAIEISAPDNDYGRQLMREVQQMLIASGGWTEKDFPEVKHVKHPELDVKAASMPVPMGHMSPGGIILDGN